MTKIQLLLKKLRPHLDDIRGYPLHCDKCGSTMAHKLVYCVNCTGLYVKTPIECLKQRIATLEEDQFTKLDHELAHEES
jgi:hypothetical protein